MTTTLLTALEKYAVDERSIIRLDDLTPAYRTPVKDFYFPNPIALKTPYVTIEDFLETIPASIAWVSEKGEEMISVGGETINYRKMKAPMFRLTDVYTADEYAEVTESAYNSQLLKGKNWIDRKYNRAVETISRGLENLCAQSMSGEIVHKIKNANNQFNDYTITLGTVADKTTAILGGAVAWDTATLAVILGHMQKTLVYFQESMPGNEMAGPNDLVFNVHDDIFAAVLALVNAQETTKVTQVTYDQNRTFTFPGGFRMRREDFTYYGITELGGVDSASKALPLLKTQVVNMNDNKSKLVYLKWNNFKYATPNPNKSALRLYRYLDTSNSGNSRGLNHVSRPFPISNTTKSCYLQVDS